jgi:hypothetical protein
MAEPQLDPGAIAQSGFNPITGSPLSSEQRKALFRRTAAPSSILSKGGALVKRTDDSSSLVVAQTQQITSLQEQINIVRVEVSSLTKGINNVGAIIRQDGILEQNGLKGEQEAERKNLEQQVRVGKENELERKIQSALARPVVALQKKVTNIFGNIFGVLSTLFMGWLTNQGIEALKAAQEGNKEKLEQIKDTVLKNIAYAIGGLAAIKIGFGLIVRTALGIASRIGAIAVRLALSPFRFLGNQLAKVPLLGRLFGGGARPSPTPRGRVPVTGGNWMTRMSNFFRGAAPATRGATSIAARGGTLIPGLNIFLGGAATIYDLSQGDYTGAALSAASMLPIIGTPAAIARLGLEGYRMTQGNDNTQQSQTQPESSNLSPTPSPAPAPQTTMMPQASELSLSPPNSSSQEASQVQSQAQNNMMQMNMNGNSSYAPPLVISSSQMQNIPNQSPNIGNLPEPQPNVVMLPAPQSKQRQSMINPSSAGSDAPLINSANPDNFYVLYSQLNYNVVM